GSMPGDQRFTQEVSGIKLYAWFGREHVHPPPALWFSEDGYRLKRAIGIINHPAMIISSSRFQLRIIAFTPFTHPMRCGKIKRGTGDRGELAGRNEFFIHR